VDAGTDTDLHDVHFVTHALYSCVHLICSSLNAHCQASLDPSHSICSLSWSCYLISHFLVPMMNGPISGSY